MLVLILILVAACFLSIYYYLFYIKDWFIGIDTKIPRSRINGLLGEASIWDKIHFPLTQLEQFRKYGKIHALRIANIVQISTYDHNISKSILKECTDKPWFLQSLGPVLGETSVLVINGDLWKTTRAVMEKMFSYQNFSRFIEDMKEVALVMVGRIKNIPRNSPIDVNKLLVDATNSIISKTMFSTLLPENVGVDICELLNLTIELQQKPWLKISPFWKIKFNSLYKDLKSYFGKVIEEHKIKTRKNPDIIDLLLEAEFDFEHTFSQILTIFFAGHDTTSHSLSWALHYIFTRPDIEEKVVKLVKTVKIEELTLPRLNSPEFNYLTNIIRESLRIQPPVSNQSRVIPRDVTIEGYEFKKGQVVNVCITALQLDPENWKNPYTFEPERWEDGERGAYFPFSTSYRVCLGKNFAMLEEKVFLFVLYNHFRFETYNQALVGPQTKLTSSPYNGLKMFAYNLN